MKTKVLGIKSNLGSILIHNIPNKINKKYPILVAKNILETIKEKEMKIEKIFESENIKYDFKLNFQDITDIKITINDKISLKKEIKEKILSINIK